MKFNVNNSVKVKLTERGLDELKRRHDELAMFYPKTFKEFVPPKVDEEGYSQFQLWDLMQRLGHLCTLGAPLPFETEIVLVLPDATK